MLNFFKDTSATLSGISFISTLIYLKEINTLHSNLKFNLNPNQDGVAKKHLPTSFSPVTSTKVGIRPQNLLTFSFNPFVTLV